MLMRRVALALLLSACVLISLPVFADSSVRIVRLSYLDGDVEMDRGTGDGMERAILNMPVTQGMQVATRDGGTAEVEFEDGSTLRLTPNTSVAFTQLALRSDGHRLSAMDLRSGTAYLESRSKKDDYTVTARGQQVNVNRQAKVRITLDDSNFRVAVFKGEADLLGNGDSARVKKEETLALDLADPGRYLLGKGIDPGTYDSWAQERDSYLTAYSSNHHDNYDSSYNYGWSDLNYYGNFFTFGSYGPLWRPYGVGSYWDPFSDGAWMWYPGYGYTWVSAYPWGWMPYRYGTWLFVPGYGWCWRPARYWNTWAVVPVVTAPPPGYVVPRPPSITASAPVSRRIIPVGRGPVTDVRDPRVGRWIQDRQQNAPPAAKSAQVTPVPQRTTAVTTKTSATTTSGTSATTTSGTTTSSATTTGGTTKTSTSTSQPTPSPTPRTTPTHNRRMAEDDRPVTTKPATTPVPRSTPPPAPAPAPAPAPRTAPPPVHTPAPAPKPTASFHSSMDSGMSHASSGGGSSHSSSSGGHH